MAPGRILRMPLFRPFSIVARPPVLPTTSRQAASATGRARGPSLGRNPLTRRPYSTSPPPSPTSTEKPTGLTGRLKHLIKTHGWYALGVYAGLSVLDFSLTFAAIYLLGADKVGAVTHKVKDRITESVGWPFATTNLGRGHDMDEGTVAAPGAGGGNEGLYAIAILAYGIHKTLWFPFRVGLVTAITPRFVAFLTRKGYVGQGGARRALEGARERVRQEAAARRSSSSSS